MRSRLHGPPCERGFSVRVCSQPANTHVVPPSPLAQLYYDPLGATPITQLVVTDAYGHASYFAAQGDYTIVFYSPRIARQVRLTSRLTPGSMVYFGTSLPLQKGCSFVPSNLPADIKTFRKAVEFWVKSYKGELEVLTELYQATNDLFPKDFGVTADTDVSGGVCEGMALEWIKKNSLGSGDEFESQVKNDWTNFAVNSIRIKHIMLSLADTQKELEAQRQKLLAEFERLEEWKALKDPASREQLNHARRKFNESLNAFEAKVAGEKRLIYKAYLTVLNQTDKSILQIEQVGGTVSLAQVGSTILGDQGNQSAYYLINMDPPGKSGHAIAIHACATPRLLDANSCEFGFKSLNGLILILLKPIIILAADHDSV